MNILPTFTLGRHYSSHNRNSLRSFIQLPKIIPWLDVGWFKIVMYLETELLMSTTDEDYGFGTSVLISEFRHLNLNGRTTSIEITSCCESRSNRWLAVTFCCLFLWDFLSHSATLKSKACLWYTYCQLDMKSFSQIPFTNEDKYKDIWR